MKIETEISIYVKIAILLSILCTFFINVYSFRIHPEQAFKLMYYSWMILPIFLVPATRYLIKKEKGEKYFK